MFSQLKSWFNRRILGVPVRGLWDERDDRNFAARVIAGEVTKVDLIDYDFQTCEPTLKHQGASDFCVGYSKAYAKEATEEKTMSGPGAFAMGCRTLGYIPEWGISILQVMKAAVKYGVPEDRLWPLTGDRKHDADWLEMNEETVRNAELHKDRSYFEIQGINEMDRFDQFRAYLHKFKDSKAVIETGVDGHAVTLIGQKWHDGELCLFGPDSYGKWNYNYRWGKCVDGYRYFNRNDARYLFIGYMAFDMPRSLAELLNAYDGKAVKLESSNDCYLIEKGERQLLVNEAVAWSHNTLLFGEDYVFVLTDEEMSEIPLGKPASFSDGANADIVRRILEKVNRTDLINEE
jgi:hypothetical protein